MFTPQACERYTHQLTLCSNLGSTERLHISGQGMTSVITLSHSLVEFRAVVPGERVVCDVMVQNETAALQTVEFALNGCSETAAVCVSEDAFGFWLIHLHVDFR